jgi:hypothetical protein
VTEATRREEARSFKCPLIYHPRPGNRFIFLHTAQRHIKGEVVAVFSARQPIQSLPSSQQHSLSRQHEVLHCLVHCRHEQVCQILPSSNWNTKIDERSASWLLRMRLCLHVSHAPAGLPSHCRASLQLPAHPSVPGLLVHLAVAVPQSRLAQSFLVLLAAVALLSHLAQWRQLPLVRLLLHLASLRSLLVRLHRK